MFQRWGFLMGEMWVLLLLAALLGLFVGWLIWGRSGSVAVNSGEADGLRASLDACNAKGRDQAARIAALEADVKAANAKAHDANLAADNARADAKASAEAASKAAAAPATMAAPLMSAPAPVKSAPAPKAAAKPKADAAPKAATATKAAAKADAAPKAAAKPKAEAAPKAAKAAAKPKVDPKTPAKPKGLTAARGGKADDLKMIKGIGPKLEILCNKLGYFHFDQIAAWTVGEVAWVDDNLEGFKGRVTRDEWVKQAAILAKGGTTEFANRVKSGDVY